MCSKRELLPKHMTLKCRPVTLKNLCLEANRQICNMMTNKETTKLVRNYVVLKAAVFVHRFVYAARTLLSLEPLESDFHHLTMCSVSSRSPEHLLWCWVMQVCCHIREKGCAGWCKCAVKFERKDMLGWFLLYQGPIINWCWVMQVRCQVREKGYARLILALSRATR